MVSLEVIRELCISGDHYNTGIPAVRKQFLLMVLMSAFLESSDFFPLLKYALKKE
jgi:hypothetical protein